MYRSYLGDGRETNWEELLEAKQHGTFKPITTSCDAVILKHHMRKFFAAAFGGQVC